MATKLIDNVDAFGQAVFYGQRFRQMVEDFLPILKTQDIRVIPITQNEWASLYRYVGDFNSFLFDRGILRQYHWTVMRVNGYRSNFDLQLETNGTLFSSLITPDFVLVDKLAQLCKEKAA